MKTKQPANLATNDLERTAKFYTGLGFKAHPGNAHALELVSFSFGENDFVVNFFLKESPPEEHPSPIAVISQNGNELIMSLSEGRKQRRK